jgi:hypothetical protein
MLSHIEDISEHSEHDYGHFVRFGSTSTDMIHVRLECIGRDVSILSVDSLVLSDRKVNYQTCQFTSPRVRASTCSKNFLFSADIA